MERIIKKNGLNFKNRKKMLMTIATFTTLASLIVTTTSCKFSVKGNSTQTNTQPTYSTTETINTNMATENSLISTETQLTSVSDTNPTSIEETYQPDSIPKSDYSELPTINNSEMGALFESIDPQTFERYIMYRAMSWEPGSPIPWFMRLWLTDHDNVSGIDWMTVPCVPDTVLDSRDANDQNVWSGPIYMGRVCEYSNIIDAFNRVCTNNDRLTYDEDMLIGQTYTSNSGETAIVDYRLMLNILVNFGDEHPDHQLSSEVFEVFGYTEEEVRNYVYEIDDENPILDYSLINSDNEYYDVYADELSGKSRTHS